MTFKPVSGAYAYCNLKSIAIGEYVLSNDEEDITTEKVYEGLLKSYERYHTLVHGEPSGVDLVAAEGGYGRAMERMIKHFVLMAAPNAVNIDQNKNKEFCFVIYAETPWDWYWHVIGIKKTVAKLKRRSPRLHDLFLAFLKALSKVGPDFWFDYAYVHVLDGIDDWDQFEDNEEVLQYKSVLRNYKEGRARKYQRLITNMPDMTAEELLAGIRRLRSCGPIIEMIRSGCEFIKEGKTMGRFIYDADGRKDERDYYGEELLQVENQMGILWDLTDGFTDRVEEWLDQACQSGNDVPRQWLMVDDTCTDLFRPDNWTGRLSLYLKKAADLMEDFTT